MSTAVVSQITQMNSNTNQVNYQSNQKNLGTGQVDKAQFLQLLMAQLQYQDPTSPMDNQQFVSEQAQFTQIDQLTQLNKTLSAQNQISQIGNMVGKYVQVKVTDPYAPQGQQVSYVTGQISSASLNSDGTYKFKMNNGNTDYDASQITNVYASQTDLNNAINSSSTSGNSGG